MLFDLPLKAALPDEKALFYSSKSTTLPRIGYIRADFGHSGDALWHSWFSGDARSYNTPEFRAELHVLMECLRINLLSSREGMHQYLREHPGLLLEDGYVKVVGYRVQTEKYVYYIRCTPSHGYYDCHIFCYANQEMVHHDK